MTPYSGSLLRLALTTVGVLAIAAAGFVYWQGGVISARGTTARAGFNQGSGPVEVAERGAR